MTNDQDKINQLSEKLDILLRRQNDFSREINQLKIEIEQLQSATSLQSSKEVPPIVDKTVTHTSVNIKSEKLTPNAESHPKEQPATVPTPKQKTSAQLISKKPKVKPKLEKFIGENLINKIGIIITIIGVSIGSKYSIEHDLINPLTRIVLGYLTGLGLMAFGIKLKKKYKNYSAVLVSGAMTIMYFITYAAYSFYDLIPQEMTFLLMLVFTAFTLVTSIHYNKQIIAHIGLVGAYAVPFLLSQGEGKVAFLFSYMAIINSAILIIAFKKYWKWLNYSSFCLTWLIYVLWYVFDYQSDNHLSLAITFLVLFFTIFYLTFLAYKLLHKEKFVVGDIILLFNNSFIFYGIGYVIFKDHAIGKHLLGVFTLANAVIHFVVSSIIYRLKLADKNLFYLIIGLVLTFITIAVPVQLDGNWVTLLWVGEAALLFWMGRTKNIAVFEKLSYPLMCLALFSLVQDWTTTYGHYVPEKPATRITPLFNVNLLSSMLFVVAFGFINFLNASKKYTSALIKDKGLSKMISFSILGILLFTMYYAFRLEIANYWGQLFKDSMITLNTDSSQYPSYYKNYDLISFKTIWIINYSLLFVSLLAVVNISKFKHIKLGFITLALILLTLVLFLTQGLYVLSELRESYLEQSLSEYYQRSIFNCYIRYISYALVALTLVYCYKLSRQKFIQRNFNQSFDFLLHITVLWMGSSELIHWIDIAGLTHTYKLGLSILWGVYALFLIVLGIWKKKKTLRIGAIALFGITLIKLFFYDISHLDTIAKTIVLVSLGILLLIISFLYNKYKHIISDETSH